VAGYIFVDAGIPAAGKSRLDLLAAELGPEIADSLAAALARGDRYPRWTAEDLRQEVPDASQRQQLVADLRPQGQAFFSEPIPVFERWPDAPCAYLQFTPGYDVTAQTARARGWACRLEPGGHFHMLANPGAVAAALASLAAPW
jgi:pimeloyl-ACP methyl ester carboxylesterase